MNLLMWPCPFCGRRLWWSEGLLHSLGGPGVALSAIDAHLAVHVDEMVAVARSA